MTEPRPLVVALPLDHETTDVLQCAAELARRLDAPIVPVHALPWRPLETADALATRAAAVLASVQSHLPAALESGARVLEPVVRRARPEELVIEEASRVHAQMIVTGGGGPATVRRWVMGSTAERIVRRAEVPVWIARGVLPTGGQILCPVDLSPQSRVGFTVALRMARLFNARLQLISVVTETERGFLQESDLVERLDQDEAKAQAQVEAFVSSQDLDGVELDIHITIGDPADRIVEAAEEASLLVVASRGFEDLRPGTLGTVTERALRFSRCSALTIRDLDDEREQRERAIRRVGELLRRGVELLEAGDAAGALPLLQMAAGRAPANPRVQQALADALDAVGRSEEADGRRALAKLIRSSFD